MYLPNIGLNNDRLGVVVTEIEALKFYGDEYNYRGFHKSGKVLIVVDNGNQAQQILADHAVLSEEATEVFTFYANITGERLIDDNGQKARKILREKFNIDMRDKWGDL